MNTISDIQPLAQRNRFGLRAYLAGSGAMVALTAAAILAFLALTTLVAFNGLPFGGGQSEADPVPVAPPLGGAPEAAALAAGAAASAAVAATPAEDSSVAPPAPSGSSAGGSGAGIAGADGAPGPAPGVPGTIPPASTSSSDVLGGTVGTLEQTGSNLGVNAPLGDVTQNVTGPLDKTLNQTLNGVGGAIDKPKLGDQLGTGVNNLTNKLLNP